MTTTTLDDLDPALLEIATTWEVVPGDGGATLAGPVAARTVTGATGRRSAARRRRDR